MTRAAACAAGLLTAVAALSLQSAIVPARALADGDPASDVLLGQNVFLPYEPMPRDVQDDLYATAAAARTAGYAVRVAVIAAPTDLGVVPSLFGKPETYARFLAQELGSVITGPVLVVMPSGFGLSVQGSRASTSALSGIAIASGTSGLGRAAIGAVRRLAAASGHRLPATVAGASPSDGAPASTTRHALRAMALLAVLAVLAAAAALRARSRRTRAFTSSSQELQ